MAKTEARKKILMIEDDIFLRRVYSDKFKQDGYTFIEATNGIEGMNKVRSERPDLLLLDLILPQKSGFEILEEMQNDKKLKKIPIVILSNLGQEVDVKSAMDLGAKDYLVKNDVSLSEVVSKVEKWLK